MTLSYEGSPEPSPSISSVSPNPITYDPADGYQVVAINGANFVNKPMVILTWTGQPGYTVPPHRVTFKSGTELSISIRLGAVAGNWTVKVTNPDGKSSNTVDFQVVPPGQNPTWARAYDGPGADTASSIQQTSDGGYIVAGYTYSFGAGSLDLWVLKLDGSGNIQWQKAYGGSDDESAYAVQQTSDGGYIVTGETLSFGGGNLNLWVLKLDANGNISFDPSKGAFATNTNITPNTTFATTTSTNASCLIQFPRTVDRRGGPCARPLIHPSAQNGKYYNQV